MKHRPAGLALSRACRELSKSRHLPKGSRLFGQKRREVAQDCVSKFCVRLSGFAASQIRCWANVRFASFRTSWSACLSRTRKSFARERRASPTSLASRCSCKKQRTRSSPITKCLRNAPPIKLCSCRRLPSSNADWVGCRNRLHGMRVFIRKRTSKGPGREICFDSESQHAQRRTEETGKAALVQAETEGADRMRRTNQRFSSAGMGWRAADIGAWMG